MDKRNEVLYFKGQLEKCSEVEVAVIHNKIDEDLRAFSDEDVQEIINELSKKGFDFISCLMYFITAKDVLITKMLDKRIDKKMEDMAANQPCREQ